MNTYSCKKCDAKLPARALIDKRVALFKVFAEKNRLKIMYILAADPHYVGQLQDHLQISQSLISHHLTQLKIHKLVISTKKKLKVYYALSRRGKQFMLLLHKLRQ